MNSKYSGFSCKLYFFSNIDKKLRQNNLLVSNNANIFLGPKHSIPFSSKISTIPISNGFSGPIITNSILFFFTQSKITPPFNMSPFS